ncbi:MAG: hypothetical protein JWQ40_4722 [Segetibacter sp.]|nr:hypothetical protein [Segetibacter sp.]
MSKGIDINELKALLEKQLHDVVAKVIKDNPLGDTPFAGYTIMQTVMDSGDLFKEEFKKSKSEIGLTNDEIDTLVNEVGKKVLKKYITNL